MTTPELDILLKSKKTEDRLKAVGAISRRADPADATRLISLLHDKSSYVALQAAETLDAVVRLEHGPILVAEFTRLQAGGIEADPGCYIRTALAYSLGRMEFHAADDVLRAGLKTVQVEAVGGVATDMGCQLRAACALALAEMRARDAVTDITPLLFDDRHRIDDPAPHAIRNPSVRQSAAKALGRLGDRSGLLPLSIKLMFPRGEEGEVLAECMEAALALDPVAGSGLIEPYLTGVDEQMIAQAAMVYARSGMPDAADKVAAAIDRLTGDAQRAVILTLASMRTDEAFEKLYALAASPRAQVRLAFVEAVATTGDPHAKPVLQELAAEDSSAPVRQAAAKALLGR